MDHRSGVRLGVALADQAGGVFELFDAVDRDPLAGELVCADAALLREECVDEIGDIKEAILRDQGVIPAHSRVAGQL